ncbi:MAG: 50S ribosomal protein L5 [archaeon]
MIKIDKVVLNIGTGTPGEKLEKAKILLERITGQKPVETLARKRIATWNIRPGLPIGAKVTLRNKKAEEVLEKCLDAVDKKLKSSNFQNHTVNFGVKEYIDIPGLNYDPNIGMYGFDVCVTLRREGVKPGRKIPNKVKIKTEETIKFMEEKFGVKVIEE